MAVEPPNDTRNRSDRLETNGVVVVLLAEEGMNKDTQKPHHTFGALINKVFWLVVNWLANLLQVCYRETRWKRL